MKSIVVVLALTAALVSGCGGGGETNQPTPAPEPPASQAPAAGANAVVVKMSEFKFEVQPSQVAPGKVTFQIENVGAVEHSFIIEELGIKTEQIRPGQTATITADMKPGTYAAICDVAGHKEAGMTLQLTVK